MRRATKAENKEKDATVLFELPPMGGWFGDDRNVSVRVIFSREYGDGSANECSFAFEFCDPESTSFRPGYVMSFGSFGRPGFALLASQAKLGSTEYVPELKDYAGPGALKLIYDIGGDAYVYGRYAYAVPDPKKALWFALNHLRSSLILMQLDSANIRTIPETSVALRIVDGLAQIAEYAAHSMPEPEKKATELIRQLTP